MKQIDVKIDKNGEVQIEVSGVAGTECKDLTKGLEKALGVVTNDVAKPEMNQKAEVKRNVDTRR